MHIGHEAGNFCYIPFAAGQKLEHILADNSSLQPHAPSSLLVGVGVDQVPGIRCTCVIWLNQITRMNATVEALSLGAFADLILMGERRGFQASQYWGAGRLEKANTKKEKCRARTKKIKRIKSKEKRGSNERMIPSLNGSRRFNPFICLSVITWGWSLRGFWVSVFPL
ncbi:uncharacterized protein BDCG_16273 [Blastomyces dermatitidis ER-3]|uniref:Uncharacterized protein n=1 Tax=Ajellomyces dermatitidis (strain ER-3 / ATCC MYA-2586) TaxID=559297 RepID=A0ABX2VSX8_AJEDR|nr:uncharacterized protein BDCG_16273 [Blastomyces dermatitidis ER-3]OAS99702.1 hypothetical protein BDCG_16273 [Blastomyces dermatitidis ER-3]